MQRVKVEPSGWHPIVGPNNVSILDISIRFGLFWLLLFEPPWFSAWLLGAFFSFFFFFSVRYGFRSGGLGIWDELIGRQVAMTIAAAAGAAGIAAVDGFRC